MRPVCIKCNREMDCKRNGVICYHPYEKPDPGPTQENIGGMTVIHTDRLMTINTSRIDFLVYGDKYRCRSCGYEIVTGFGQPMIDYEVPQEQLKHLLTYAKEAIEIRRR